MWETVQTYFSGPMLVPSALLALVLLYWLFVILGAFDMDVLDIDADLDIGGDSIFGIGFVALRFLNIGDVPIMVWSSVFGLSFWIITAMVVRLFADGISASPVVAVIGSGLVAMFLSKLITNPLRGKFNAKEPNTVADLMGQTCVITAETNKQYGQAEIRTSAAPLLLNVRTLEGTLAKGTQAKIDDFDAENHLYYVSGSEGKV